MQKTAIKCYKELRVAFFRFADFLKNETIIGNAYIYSAPKQPYTFSCRVLEFNKLNIENLLQESRVSFQKAVTQEMQELTACRDDRGDEESTRIGRFSRNAYKYFGRQGIDLPFADHENQYIDWEYAHNLYKQFQLEGQEDHQIF